MRKIKSKKVHIKKKQIHPYNKLNNHYISILYILKQAVMSGKRVVLTDTTLFHLLTIKTKALSLPKKLITTDEKKSIALRYFMYN